MRLLSNLIKRSYYSFLYLGAILTENRFSGFHKLVRVFYRNVFMPCLRIGLPYRLDVRHSAQVGPDRFNAFLSDIDLNVVIDQEFEENARRVRDRVIRARKWFPFLGEIEIYERREWEAWNRLQAEAGEIYFYIRHLRKMAWMEFAHAQAKTEYHRYKALRAIRICLEKLSGREHPMSSVSGFSNAWAVRTDVMEFLKRHFEAELDRATPIQVQLNSDESYRTYLGVRLESLRLPSKYIAVVLGICPLVQFKTESSAAALAKIRQESKIRETWRALSQMEWIQFQASDRAYAEERGWVGPWKKALQDEARAFKDSVNES